jgi:hypothetical protein
MPPKKPASPEGSAEDSQSIYQLKVTLLDSAPPIWRRFEISRDLTLRKLHPILQVVMGWENEHLHDFYKGRERLSKSLRLFQAASRARSKFIYLYDMGDSWEHEIVVEKVLKVQEGKSHPVCLEGRRACPPEDCGGIYGYTEMLDALKNPDHPEREHWLEWAGDDFDAEAFDLDAVNRRLKRYKL